LAGVATTAEVVGMEINTDVRTSVTRKTGLQVVDVATSTCDGADISAGVYIIRDAGGVGWQSAIQFGDSSSPSTAPTNVNLLYLAGAPLSVALHRGIDFRAGSFSLPAIDLPPGASIAFGGGAAGLSGVGGAIISVTTADGPVIELGNSALAVMDNAATEQALTVITTPGSQSVSVYIPTLGLRQIVAGAENSGGTGLRLLVCSN
jgi:hypothetical protein